MNRSKIKPAPYSLYLVLCKNGSIYTGITTDVARRVSEHKAGTGARYTRAFGVTRLLYSEAVGTKSEALRREAAVKRLPAAAKRLLTKAVTKHSL